MKNDEEYLKRFTRDHVLFDIRKGERRFSDLFFFASVPGTLGDNYGRNPLPYDCLIKGFNVTVLEEKLSFAKYEVLHSAKLCFEVNGRILINTSLSDMIDMCGAMWYPDLKSERRPITSTRKKINVKKRLLLPDVVTTREIEETGFIDEHIVYWTVSPPTRWFWLTEPILVKNSQSFNLRIDGTGIGDIKMKASMKVLANYDNF